MDMTIPAAIHVEMALDELAHETPARRIELLAETAHELYSVGPPQFLAAGFASGTFTFDAGYLLGLRVAAALVAGGGEL
jgi:hypothetical protein